MNGNDVENGQASVWIDDLDQKLIEAFPGRVVRKDLVQKLKVGFSIPVYVLEYLLGKHCSTTDEEQIEAGIERVKSEIAERVVRSDQRELLKSKLHRTGSIKIIDQVTATLDETVEGGKYWAHLVTAGLDKVNISVNLIDKYERVFTGGVWALVELTYDESLVYRGEVRPFLITDMRPIQIASARLEEYKEARQKFTREEWVDVLIRTMGYEPSHPDFTWRVRLLYLLRFIPFVQKNFNMIELGPKETGKSFVYRQISPHVILVSGGQGSVPDLFGWKGRKDRPGLVVRNDAVAFDEVAGQNFKAAADKQMYQDYMESGSFSRGDDKGEVTANAGMMFVGNIKGDIRNLARTSHLLMPLPETLRDADAFHDRLHAYLPGWEIPKLIPDHFTSHLGFIADYIAEIFHAGLRDLSFTNAYEQYFTLGDQLGHRDRVAVMRTTSGLIKLIHPDGDYTKEELKEYVELALELRRRVKEQIKHMNPDEFSKVDLSLVDKETGQEKVVYCPESYEPD